VAGRYNAESRLRFFKRAGFDVVFLDPQKPFSRPNSRSTLNFDHSLQNT
jgi:hypothetical protein